MNWMGGARSRISKCEAKRKQKDYFEKMRAAKLFKIEANPKETNPLFFFHSPYNSKEKNHFDPSNKFNEKSSIVAGKIGSRRQRGSVNLSVSPIVKASRINLSSPKSRTKGYAPGKSKLGDWCGEIRKHLNEEDGSKDVMKKNKVLVGDSFSPEDFQRNKDAGISFSSLNNLSKAKINVQSSSKKASKEFCCPIPPAHSHEVTLRAKRIPCSDSHKKSSRLYQGHQPSVIPASPFARNSKDTCFNLMFQPTISRPFPELIIYSSSDEENSPLFQINQLKDINAQYCNNEQSQENSDQCCFELQLQPTHEECHKEDCSFLGNANSMEEEERFQNSLRKLTGSAQDSKYETCLDKGATRNLLGSFVHLSNKSYTTDDPISQYFERSNENSSTYQSILNTFSSSNRSKQSRRNVSKGVLEEVMGLDFELTRSQCKPLLTSGRPFSDSDMSDIPTFQNPPIKNSTSFYIERDLIAKNRVKDSKVLLPTKYYKECESQTDIMSTNVKHAEVQTECELSFQIATNPPITTQTKDCSVQCQMICSPARELNQVKVLVRRLSI